MTEIDWAKHDHRKYILERIKTLEVRNPNNPLDSTPSWWATHKNIWQGSYDVWFCEQDRIDAVDIPKAQMKIAEEEGLIESEMKTWQGYSKEYKTEVWSVTERGEEFLNKSSSSQPVPPQDAQ